ncbi:MAG: NFACT family protein [Nanoarchaeota archaeon]|nr:NFACT family protein [Nanoarchaeota archaeon]
MKKRELSALELGIMAKELQLLKGARLQKLFQQGKKEFLFHFHVPNEGKRLLKIVFPTYIFFTDTKPPQAEPPMFCQRLRKLLAGCWIRSIAQHGFERILILELEAKEKLTMILELFGTGNLIILKDKKIEMVLEKRMWKDREITRGAEYKFPESVDLRSMDSKTFSETISRAGDSIVKFLATRFFLGGIFAEELCLRAGVDKNAKSLTAEEKQTLFQELGNLLAERPAPYETQEGEIAPFKMKLHEGKETNPLPSLSAAVEILSKMHEAPKKTAQDMEREKLERIKEEQLKQFKALEQSIEENTQKGQAVFENYALMKEALDTMKNNKTPNKRLSRFIKSHDKKSKTLTLEP